MMLRTIVVSVLLSLTGCGWMASSVVDQVTGLPASSVISDVKNTSDEYEQEKHQERVEELSKEYEEFLRSRDSNGSTEDSTERSVIILKDSGNDSND